jgi:hypothetical protein
MKGLITADSKEELSQIVSNIKNNFFNNPNNNKGIEKAIVSIKKELLKTIQGEKEIDVFYLYSPLNKEKALAYIKLIPGLEDNEMIVLVGGEEEQNVFKKIKNFTGDKMSTRVAQTKKPIKETKLLNIYKNIVYGK